jgi:hypothetical protein
MRTSINELETMSEAEKRYRIYERMEEMYLSNMDYKQALACKWSMAANYGGNH